MERSGRRSLFSVGSVVTQSFHRTLSVPGWMEVEQFYRYPVVVPEAGDSIVALVGKWAK
jgi:hypothetical protein